MTAWASAKQHPLQLTGAAILQNRDFIFLLQSSAKERKRYAALESSEDACKAIPSLPGHYRCLHSSCTVKKNQLNKYLNWRMSPGQGVLCLLPTSQSLELGGGVFPPSLTMQDEWRVSSRVGQMHPALTPTGYFKIGIVGFQALSAKTIFIPLLSLFLLVNRICHLLTRCSCLSQSLPNNSIFVQVF